MGRTNRAASTFRRYVEDKHTKTYDHKRVDERMLNAIKLVKFVDVKRRKRTEESFNYSKYKLQF
ncbi:MAG TPA: hypothetical protein VGF14_08195 [Alphaproteobacteria bacterium]